MWSAVGINSLQLKPISIAVISLLGNAIDAAVSILSKYGGSLWVADPAYVFTGSDGTGAAGDGSDAGYVHDLCATYGAELLPSSWIGINSSFTNQGLSVVKTANVAANTISLSLSGTAAAAFSDPINNLLSSSVPTNGGEVFELSAVGYESVTPAGAATKLLLVEMNTNLSYLRGTLVPLGSKSVVTLGADCKFIRLAVYVGNWTVGAAVSANITLQKPSLRQIIGRPLFQSTTGFKPKLKRVPKRLGPELVTNGNFSVASGWAGAGTSSVVISGGQLTMTSSGAGYAARAESTTPFALNVGSTYVLAVNATTAGGTFRLGSTQGQPQLYQNATLVAGYTAVTWVATAAQAYFSLVGSSVPGTQHTYSQASVREVLEWGWAWVFDGVDDLLATASLPVVTGETFLTAAKITTPSTANYHPIISKREGNSNGSYIRREQTSGTTIAGIAEAGGAFPTVVVRLNDTDMTAQVYGQKITGASNIGRRNGVQVNTTPCVPNPVLSPVRLAAVTSFRMQGEIYAAAYAPAAIPDAELLIIEQALGQLAGLTL